MKFFYITNIFDLQIFDNKTVALLKCFKICMEMCFVYLFILNGRNITTSLLMIRLKSIVVYCANLNSRPITKQFFKLRLIEYAISFSQILIYVYFSKTFVKNFRENSLFNTNFRNSFQDVVYYRILGCQTL